MKNNLIGFNTSSSTNDLQLMTFIEKHLFLKQSKYKTNGIIHDGCNVKVDMFHDKNASEEASKKLDIKVLGNVGSLKGADSIEEFI